jgi:hypothetical protein
MGLKTNNLYLLTLALTEIVECDISFSCRERDDVLSSSVALWLKSGGSVKAFWNPVSIIEKLVQDSLRTDVMDSI